ncbi:MAG: hypothetical protein OHK0022_49830 [Roseiflexaceae bacterium]
MTLTRLIRLGGLAGMLGGVLWAAAGLSVAELEGAAARLPGDPALRYGLARLLCGAALLLLLPALASVAARWAPASAWRPGGLCGIGLGGATLGVALALVGMALDHAPHFRWLGERNDAAAALFGFGLLNLCVGMVLVGGTGLGRRPGPSWQTAPLLLGLLGMMGLVLGRVLGGGAGFALWTLFGLSWVWLGAILRAVTPAGAPSAQEPHSAAHKRIVMLILALVISGGVFGMGPGSAVAANTCNDHSRETINTGGRNVTGSSSAMWYSGSVACAFHGPPNYAIYYVCTGGGDGCHA